MSRERDLLRAELRRIADAMENQSMSVATLAEWTVSTFDRPPCDCDELWRLAREYVDDGQAGEKYQALRAYVREHS